MVEQLSPSTESPSVPIYNGNEVNTNHSSRFKISLSFCGEYRNTVVVPILNVFLSQGYTKNDVFYDEWHSHLLRAGRADTDAIDIYENRCDLVVVFLSKNYDDKIWTGGIEWDAVRRIMHKKERAGSICLLNVDGVDINEIRGLSNHTSVAKRIDTLSPEQVVSYIHLCTNAAPEQGYSEHKHSRFDVTTIKSSVTLRKLLRDNTSEYASDIITAVRYMADINCGELRKLCQELIVAGRTDEPLFDSAIHALANGNQNELAHVFESLCPIDRTTFNRYFFDEKLITKEKIRTRLTINLSLS